MIKKLLLPFLVLLVNHSLAQEICNNGIDDDGDGLVDCYDSDCSGNSDCSDFFYGKPVTSCTMAPTNPAFSLNLRWQSNTNVSTRSTMMVGDIDGDGTPEVICHQSSANQLYILDGLTGNLETTVNCPAISDYGNAIALGDADGDGLGEIYVLSADGFLRCFENDGTAKVSFTAINTGYNQELVPDIADFNGDGTPEIYVGNKIYNSITGALIVAGSGSYGKNPALPSAYPAAADVLPDSYCPDCSGLELICGNTVFSVNISTGTLTAMANSLPNSLDDGYTALADLDLDGQLDVVVTSSGTIYTWDPRTGLQMGNTFGIPNTTSGGRPNIADYDNDGLPEIGAGGNSRYVVVDVDTATGTLTQKWLKTIVDGSAHTTASVFDFDCDGAAEVVYRDENTLYVWDGSTGNLKASNQCGSATRSEFPTIVDVDGDGQVNIVCACATGNGGAAGQVRVYNSSTNQWVGSRKVMNQSAYSVVNINDNLSIPKVQQNMAGITKLNGYLAQSPIYDVNWNSTCIPLADMTVSVDSVIYCLKPDSIVMLLDICNIGSKVNGTPLNISVYNGDPISGGTLLSSFAHSKLIYAESCSKDTLVVPFTGSAAIFYVFVNDNGTNAQSAPQTTFVECDSSNNSDNVPINVPHLVLEVGGNTFICKSDSTELTMAGASIYEWSPSTGLSDSVGNNIFAHPLTTTTYTITGTDTITGCHDTVSVTITVIEPPHAIFGFTNVCDGVETVFADTSATSSGVITSWRWNFGDNDSVLTHNPTHVYDSAGFYTTTLIVSSSFGCKDTISHQVQVYYNPVAAFTTNDVCLGDSVYFVGSSSLQAPAIISNYSWNFNENNSGSSLTNPSHLYSTAGTYNVKLVVISNEGCKDSTTHQVHAFDPPVAAFSIANSCLKDSVVITNTSQNPTMGSIADWVWDFGDSSPLDSNNWNPNHLYPSTGIYAVTLITYSSNLGCADTITDSVSIYPMPMANFSSNEVCLNNATSFSDSSNIVSGGITTWNWTFGDNTSPSTLQNPNHTYPSFGSFDVTLIVTSDFGCKDTITHPVVVHPLPVAAYSANNVCDGATVSFTDNSSVPTNTTNDIVQQWLWNLGDGPNVNTQNASHLYPAAGSYPIQLNIESSFGCIDSAIGTIVINPNPVVSFATSDTMGCSPLCVTYQNTSNVPGGGVLGWLWDLGDGNTSVSQDAVHCYSASNGITETFSPALTVTSDSGCVEVLTKPNYINVFPMPVAQFTVAPEVITITNPVISITNSSTVATIWSWSFGDGSADSVQTPASHNYTDTGSYIITLIASTQYNCIDTTYQNIIVQPEFFFYVPSAFSPNGDGVNDVFIGSGVFFLDFKMLIFDRWGNLIFKTESIEKPWDGKANNGLELAQQDVYVYSVTVTDFQFVKHQFRGIVSLIR